MGINSTYTVYWVMFLSSFLNRFPLVFVSLVMLGFSSSINADAIVVSQAMFADTIAEYFVEEDHVRVELEIGASDLDVFRNLLPDGIHQQMGHPPRPIQERIVEFFERDLSILADGELLRGAVANMGPETRIQRDAVTGEPLPADDEEPEVVVAATLIYPFAQRPDSLTLGAPSATGMAGIGFVLYHQGVAVNDFRFLSNGSTIDLDWEDPWYSAYRTRSMRRQYFSPMAGFLYVEPFEVRKEIILRPKDVHRWTDLGLDGVDTITPEMQESVKAGIVEFLSDKFQVAIDGEPVEGVIDRVNFLERTLRSSVVLDNRDIATLPATVGVIYVFPTDGLPQKVEMEWDLFTERMQMVPASTVDQAGPLPTFLEPDFSTLTWENFLKYPELPTLTEIRLPPTPLQALARWGQWLFGVVALLSLAACWRRRAQGASGMLLAVTALTVLLAAGSAYAWRSVQLNPERTGELVGSLLHNVYRAFDYRGEEPVYDVLARSVSGGLLADVYLETRQGLELANQGGAKVKVKDIEMLETRLLESVASQFTVEARWNVFGSVGHWGHVHQRTNAYHAKITVADVDGAWKLTGLDILEEERL
jgi:hypothetical protein